MKKIAIAALLLGTPLLSGPLQAAEKTGTSGKELCMLYTQQCSGKMQRFQAKIKKIQTEIAKGATVYSPAEIDKLETQLKAAEDQMDAVMKSATPATPTR